MASESDQLQADINATIDLMPAAKKKRPRLSPQTWEQLAQYVEAKYTSSLLRAVQAEDLLKSGVGNIHLEAQIMFWRATHAVAKKIAYDFRVGRDGPWNLKSNRTPERAD